MSLKPDLRVQLQLARFRLCCFALQSSDRPVERQHFAVQMYTACLRAVDIASDHEDAWMYWPRSVTNCLLFSMASDASRSI